MRAMMGIVALVSACGGTSSWPSATVPTVSVGSPAVAFEAALTMLRRFGYEVEDYDPVRGFIQVQSKIDGDVTARGVSWGGMSTARAVERISHIGFQFTPDGMLTIIPRGYHVHRGTMDPRLAGEIDRIIDAIVDQTERMLLWAAPPPTRSP